MAHSTKNPILHTLLSLVSDQNTLTVHRAVVEFLDGNFEAALLLEQLLYWTPRAKQNSGWIAKSFTEWRQEVFLSRYSVEKARRYLKDRGLLEWEIRRFRNSPTAFYRVALDELAKQWEAFVKQREQREVDLETPQKAPAEIDRCSEEPQKAPAEISKCPEDGAKAPAEISKPPAEISRSPAEISKSLTEITTEITHIHTPTDRTATTTTTTVKGGGQKVAVVVAEPELPEDVARALDALGWVGSMAEIAHAWQADPERVRAWLGYAQREGLGAGWLRKTLRENPGYPPAELAMDNEVARRRYREGPYAAFFEADEDGEPEAGQVADAGDYAKTTQASPVPPDVLRWWTMAVGQLLAEGLSKADFDAWVYPARVLAFDNDRNGQAVLTVGVANAYARDWLDDRLGRTLEHKISGLAGVPVQVQFVLEVE